MADTFGTPFFLPFQSFLKHPSLASGFNVEPALARQYFYTAGGSVGKRVFADPACKYAQPQPLKASANGLFPPVYLKPDGDDEYKGALSAIIGATFDTESSMYSIDDVPRYQENFETDTFTVTWTGFSSAPSSTTATYYRFGRLCLLVLPGGNGTSNATSFGLSGVPLAIRPSTVQVGHYAFAVDNGTHIVGGCYSRLNTDGTMDFFKADAAYTLSGWTASGAKGLYFQQSTNHAPNFFYRIDDT